MNALFQAPPGCVPIGGTVSVFWVLAHPDNADVQLSSGGLTNSHEPLAAVNLGNVQAALDPNGNAWIPTLNDLTPAGRMVRDILIDNAPVAGGREQLLHNFQMSVHGAMRDLQHAMVN